MLTVDLERLARRLPPRPLTRLCGQPDPLPAPREIRPADLAGLLAAS